MAADSGGSAVEPLYRGRFAPTPFGPLHFGSLVAAVGSYLDARRHGGEWLVRMEDLDPPRVVPGAADEILRTLEAFGFEWDGPVVFQSARTSAYREAFEVLRREGNVYACACTRAVSEGQGCSGTCRGGLARNQTIRSWRVHVPGQPIAWHDRLAGESVAYCEDFTVWRGDGVFAYQLAVVVDDEWQRVSNVVRGADLWDSTPKQVGLQRLLGFRTPEYLHLPVAMNARGEKLSKQTRAPALRVEDRAGQILRALEFLGQAPTLELLDLDAVWNWARVNWDARRIKNYAAANCSSMSGVGEGFPSR